MKLRKFYTLVLTSVPFLTVDPAHAQIQASKFPYPPSVQMSTNGIPEMPNSSNHPLPSSATPNWFAEVSNNIQELENAFYPTAHNKYRVANSTHRIAFDISQKGYTVYQVSQQYKEETWKMQFNILGAGRRRLQWTPKQSFESASGNDMLRYMYKEVEVQYTNSTDGLRQNFIINQRPDGNQPLQVRMRITGTLKTILENNSLRFVSRDSLQQTKLMYQDLKVWDNQYKPLNASMKLKGDILTIEVDDANAQYPITIDPINKTPDWKTNTNGVLAGLGLSNLQILTSLYGFAVCGLGDVNDDGYGDVAVSAPGLIGVLGNSSSLVSVGAVFVYYGSAAGLATTPAKTLQPNTAVAGALFGTSIDAGDVTGDGINDIVIGAPLDHVELSAGLGTIDGTVGKVYVYPGGTLAAPNPSNFLTLTVSTAHVGGINIKLNALFGFSVGVTDDLNKDGKQDIVVGAPGYVKVELAGLVKTQTGAAFVCLSNKNNNSFSNMVQLEPPTFSLLGIPLPLLNGIAGLMFGLSVDGVGDYNGDGAPDVVVGAPAGVNLTGLLDILNGQILGGSAYVYYGKTDKTGINSNIGCRLQAASTGLLGNAANLFGFKVKGVKGIDGKKNGNIVVGAPLGGLLSNALSLNIKTGNVHVFKKKAAGYSGNVEVANQVLESPRPSNLLQGLFSGTLQLSVLFGTSMDNGYDVNSDGFPDIIIGEPLSSGVNLGMLQTNLVGGSAYIYYGDATGGYNTTPGFEVSATYGNEFLSVNATALFGFSVTGVQKITNPSKVSMVSGKTSTLSIASSPTRLVVGSPLSALDFSSSVLNLGSTLGTTFNFAAGSNGLGKAYSFDAMSTTLPVTITSIKAEAKNNSTVDINWNVREELNLDRYELERSSDGKNFESIALVFPWDNSQVSNTYQYSDKKPFMGINFYRLKSVDKDGSSKYSLIVAAKIGQTVTTSIAIAPNPVQGNIRAIFSGLVKGNYTTELRNVAGQLQFSKSINIQQQDQIVYFERGNAAPGIYWLTVFDNAGQKVGTSRVIVQ
ncbi:hypothetical protein HHL16_05440 [Pseudoflavitalea sp. G-6-1-2]|uniref:DUF7948 domain-containing protein n=1 Tax=Pseudoflavitalea sp. G-6-1-2 TaxID=2728841 RepID=UPI00146AA525|nr:FG-GAP-like repeat-containing protein [Pseudoflavitalea sp. G-6-1-2]NML20304.1 hypothetical protein [Pseudoflavitalea sp. G-6-1-2]